MEEQEGDAEIAVVADLPPAAEPAPVELVQPPAASTSAATTLSSSLDHDVGWKRSINEIPTDLD